VIGLTAPCPRPGWLQSTGLDRLDLASGVMRCLVGLGLVIAGDDPHPSVHVDVEAPRLLELSPHRVPETDAGGKIINEADDPLSARTGSRLVTRMFDVLMRAGRDRNAMKIDHSEG
jgi:hypothetical protein